MALDLLSKFLEHVNLTGSTSTLLESAHDLLSPLAALSAGSALAAGLVAVEVAETADSSNNIGALIKDNDSGGTKTRLAILQSIKVHDLVIANVLGEDRSGRSTGNDGQEVVPTASDTTTVLLNQLTEGNGHLLLNGARVVDHARDAKKLGALVSLTTKAGEPASSSSAYGRGDSDSLDVGDGRRASEKTNGSRKRGLETRLARLALK